MKLKIPRTIETEVELTPPLFWRSRMSERATEMLAYINEETIVSLYDSEGCTIVKNTQPWLSDVTNAFNKWQPITEQEFMEALETATQKLTLKPVSHETLAH